MVTANGRQTQGNYDEEGYRSGVHRLSSSEGATSTEHSGSICRSAGRKSSLPGEEMHLQSFTGPRILLLLL